MKITFSIVRRNRSWLADIEGEIIDVAPHLAHLMTFAVHKSIYSDYWMVSNIEIGGRICDGLTKKLATKAAQTLLAGKTAADIRRAYRKHGYRP